MLYLLSFIAFLSLIILLSIYYKQHIIPHLPSRIRAMLPPSSYAHLHYAPLNSFADQAAHGMNSASFDIEANIRDGDERTGLDERGAREVLEIMKRERVTFDQARLIRQNRILAENGIDPSGMPLDSKAVTRL
ncbi:hypothetical protein PNOK_0451500 [Pyrrhoderma noxium]|uniref:Uncharacterized protein n=1 Tax=Pyrrhoderma noxium TaxID=2282107 RepID=A0A286UIY9_9AGAM|nr:hypothetical protein PNOK_0451500 [Pyrrhoderma noxium]